MAVWQSVQPKIPCTLAACFAGSIEMLFPLSDFMPAWPWQARQLSSCLRGWGDCECGFAWDRAQAAGGVQTETRQVAKSNTKKTTPNLPAASVARRVLLRKLTLPRFATLKAS